MTRNSEGQLVYSPTDLTRFAASPFASWMDRYHLEFPDTITPDPLTDDQSLVIQTGIKHEAAVLHEFKASGVSIIEIRAHNQIEARRLTQAALVDQPSMIYQAALELGQFAGYADFLLLNENGHYHVWDTKLARSPKPNYAIQLCCYSEMLAADTDGRMPETFGIILGTNERVEFRVEDFIHYYSLLFKGVSLASGRIAQSPDRETIMGDGPRMHKRTFWKPTI